MTMYLLTEEQANHVRGMYGMFYRLTPTPYRDGMYILPSDILQCHAFSHLAGYFENVQIIEYNPEVTDETI